MTIIRVMMLFLLFISFKLMVQMLGIIHEYQTIIVKSLMQLFSKYNRLDGEYLGIVQLKLEHAQI